MYNRIGRIVPRIQHYALFRGLDRVLFERKGRNAWRMHDCIAFFKLSNNFGIKAHPNCIYNSIYMTSLAEEQAKILAAVVAGQASFSELHIHTKGYIQ